MNNQNISLKYDIFIGYPNDNNIDIYLKNIKTSLSSGGQINANDFKNYNKFLLVDKITKLKNNNKLDIEQKNALRYGKTLQYIMTHTKLENKRMVDLVTNILEKLIDVFE